MTYYEKSKNFFRICSFFPKVKLFFEIPCCGSEVMWIIIWILRLIRSYTFVMRTFFFIFGNIFNDFVKISDYILKYRSKMTMIISIKVSTIKIIFNEKSLIRILKNHTNLTWYGYIIHLIFYFAAYLFWQ